MGALMTEDRPVAPALVRRWREAETSFFGQSMADPDMYVASLAVVRGLADGLSDVTSEEELQAADEARGDDWLEARLAAIDVPHADWLDLDRARDAAFNLRLGALRVEIQARTTAERLATARRAGEAWIVAIDGEIGLPGRRTYRRVEIHTRAGVALSVWSERDWSRGETFWMEVLRVDPETGVQVPGAAPLEELSSFDDHTALDRALARARRRHGSAA
jgi:hypothetical protein